MASHEAKTDMPHNTSLEKPVNRSNFTAPQPHSDTKFTRSAFFYSLAIPILLVICITLIGISAARMETTMHTTPYTLLELNCSGSSCDVTFLNERYSFQHVPLETVEKEIEYWFSLTPPFLQLISQAGIAISDTVVFGCENVINQFFR